MSDKSIEMICVTITVSVVMVSYFIFLYKMYNRGSE